MSQPFRVHIFLAWFVFFITMFLYYIFAVIHLHFGIMDAPKCDKTLYRWEYFMPTYRLGCWLGEPVGGKE